MMYLDYLKEREGKDSICSPKGFIVYKIEGKVCHVAECYTAPQYRRERVAWEFMDKVFQIAKSEGCVLATACVVPSLAGASESMAAQLEYGFKIDRSINDCIIMSKEI